MSRALTLTLDLAQAAIRCLAFQCLFNTQQLVVLGNPVRTAQRTSLDLACAGSNRQVSNGGIFGFTGTVGNHRRVAGVLSHLDSVQSLGQATNLVELDQDGIAHTLLDALLQEDRKSTRLNSSHVRISYAVVCLKKKKDPITHA